MAAHKKVIEMMKEATGASDDDVCLMLQLCDGDPNKATEALLASACFWGGWLWLVGGRWGGRERRVRRCGRPACTHIYACSC